MVWEATPGISPRTSSGDPLVQSFKVGRVAGIDLYVHWTFLILLAFYAIQGLASGGIATALFNSALILAVFGCVLLHELGHSLTARRFGIGTWGITLTPIGGLASLERMPREPRLEFWITVAGPAVNVVIAALLYGLTSLVDVSAISSRAMFIGYTFLVQLMWINVGLVVFNLLPAFPMDGGRILRATLASWLNYRDATKIAVRVGQVVAVGIGIASILGYLSLMGLLIAYFVFISGEEELQRGEYYY